jgi:hypothetical protein
MYLLEATNQQIAQAPSDNGDASLLDNRLISFVIVQSCFDLYKLAGQRSKY